MGIDWLGILMALGVLVIPMLIGWIVLFGGKKRWLRPQSSTLDARATHGQRR
jgi:hypothetical protein